MHLQSIIPLLLILAPPTLAHFTMSVPKSIGYNDAREGEGPCGSFDIRSRVDEVEFPVSGHPLGMISTHPEANWQVRYALLNDTGRLELLVPPIKQTGLGRFCIPEMRASQGLAGSDGVIQVTQNAVDGTLYQCIAVKFVDKPAMTVEGLANPGDCRNSSNIRAEFDPSAGGVLTNGTHNHGGGGDGGSSGGGSGASRAVAGWSVGVFGSLMVGLHLLA